MTPVVRTVSTRLLLAVIEPTEAFLQVAPPRTGGVVESLTVTTDGKVVPVTEVTVPGMGRVHRFPAAPGRLDIAYDATVEGLVETAPVSAADEITYVRPSRYAESDRLTAVAHAEFAGISRPEDLLSAVSSWVGTHLSYVPGSSRPTDGAVETLLQRQGVCRDYAHLVIALLRGLDVPARLTAVYAPGLHPMDFHAVAEAAIGGIWYAVDATLLAPRSSLLRICTGRDAADTAFLSTYGGEARLLWTSVSASVDGELPDDDVFSLVTLS
ncbi:MAG: transglutaminase-like domain-containing protein [Acidimicrobiales bacterium]